jgi:laccase
MLRLINSALNDELFFGIANHTLTVVEADANYVKPFTVQTLVISPGQTMNVLLTTATNPASPAYAMAISPYTNTQGTFDNTTAAAVLEYAPTPASSAAARSLPLPALPLYNDTGAVTNFSRNFRSLDSAQYPAHVPLAVDRHLLFTVGLGTDPCPSNQTCQGPNGTKFAASISNNSFFRPRTALLEAHYQRRYAGVLLANFPTTPPHPFNYTGTPPNNTFVQHGTRVVPLRFNTSVELVLQGTSIQGAESHPLHLHGYDFYVVGQGFGNFDPVNDPPKYNLADPVERNTISVPTAGWVALRFFADNPGNAWSTDRSYLRPRSDVDDQLGSMTFVDRAMTNVDSVCMCGRGVAHALPLRRSLELGPVHGVARQRRPPAESEDATPAVRSSEMLMTDDQLSSSDPLSSEGFGACLRIFLTVFETIRFGIFN